MNATSQQMAARRYRIERYLTEGGMGAIYVGKKLGPGGFEKDVVLKQLLPEHTSRPEFRDLFFREAKISATLDHANIVHTFDLVESDESLFIVMEYVRGADLRTICRRAKLRRRQLAPAAAIQIALEILAGLSYAHTRRDPNGVSLDIIHRDVSPSNILCSAQGEVKLSDFGIAKASTHSSVFYRVRGKVGYMSPEQARNQPIDARTDLYSVAVCLYEALTGERLFVGDLSTPPDVIYGQPIAPTSYKRPGLPRALDHVMATALAPDPDDRYQDARAFAEALRQVAHHHGMLSSAPQLADDLRDILGPDPNRWLQEDADAYPAPETQKIQSKALEGKEASSIGVVDGQRGVHRRRRQLEVAHGHRPRATTPTSWIWTRCWRSAPRRRPRADRAAAVVGVGRRQRRFAAGDPDRRRRGRGRADVALAAVRAPRTGRAAAAARRAPAAATSAAAARPARAASQRRRHRRRRRPPAVGRARVAVRGGRGAVRASRSSRSRPASTATPLPVADHRLAAARHALRHARTAASRRCRRPADASGSRRRTRAASAAARRARFVASHPHARAGAPPPPPHNGFAAPPPAAGVPTPIARPGRQRALPVPPRPVPIRTAARGDRRRPLGRGRGRCEAGSDRHPRRSHDARARRRRRTGR